MNFLRQSEWDLEQWTTSSLAPPQDVLADVRERFVSANAADGVGCLAPNQL
jgi:hypothetical protein